MEYQVNNLQVELYKEISHLKKGQLLKMSDKEQVL